MSRKRSAPGAAVSNRNPQRHRRPSSARTVRERSPIRKPSSARTVRERSPIRTRSGSQTRMKQLVLAAGMAVVAVLLALVRELLRS